MSTDPPDYATPNASPLVESLEVFATGIERSGQLDASTLCGTRVERLGDLFGLSPAEVTAFGVLLGASLSRRVGTALEARFGSSVVTIGGLQELVQGLPWMSFSPSSGFVKWLLVDFARNANLCDTRIGPDPRIAQWCLEASGCDERLVPHRYQTRPARFLLDSHASVVAETMDVFAREAASTGQAVCLIVGEGSATRERVAHDIAAHVGMSPLSLSQSIFGGSAADRSLLLKLAARESVLSRTLPIIELQRLGPAERDGLRALAGPAIVHAQNLELGASLPPLVEVVSLASPDPSARATLWQSHLRIEETAEAEMLAEAFEIGADDIAAICQGLDSLPRPGRIDAAWTAARRVLAPPPDPLVLELKPQVGWDDLVVPFATRSALRAIAAQSKYRTQVYRRWEFGSKASRGLGISALFAGPSGTGKTLAAEVIAADLARRLLRVNLAQVLDKYVGETEKHVDHLFALAERSGAILLFDEADALFRRRDGDNPQEKFASMTVAYLLQRFESSTATCLLTTNIPGAVDDAFRRRIRVVVEFAFPDANDRLRLWERAFPSAAPLGMLDLKRLAKLPATGGTIRNVAVNAAFLAAEAESAIEMEHVFVALELENAKLSQPIDLGPIRRRAA